MSKSKLKEVQANVRKHFGTDSILMLMGDSEPVEVIPTGIYSMDKALGCGGFPKGRMVEIYGPESCQPAGSQVLMSDGTFKNIENISIGDKVLSPQKDGSYEFSKVLHTTSWISKENYALISRRRSNKVLYKCSHNHIIPINHLESRKIPKTRAKCHFHTLKELTAKELSTCAKSFINDSHVFTMPVIRDFDHSEADPSLHPYVLGVFLGDESIGKTKLGLTTADDKILKKLEKLGGKFKIYKDKRSTAKNCWMQLDHGWVREFQKLKLWGTTSHTKFIPNSAKYASLSYRVNLLAGLIDTDGSKIVSKDRTKTYQAKYDYSTTSRQLAYDIQFLVHSLGGYCHISSRTTSPNKGQTNFPSFRLYIALNYKLPLVLSRKRIKYVPKNTSDITHQGFSITKSKKEKVFGFVLDSKSNWYITDNYIVTHNSGKTTLALYAVAEAQKKGQIAAFIDAEHSLDLNMAKQLGVNVDELLMSQPDNGEQALELVEHLVRLGDVGVVVVDSVAALTPKAEIDGEMGGSHMGLQARLMSQACRKLVGIASKSDTTIIWINQVRSKIGVFFGSPEVTTGGNALKFYAAIRLEARKGDSIKEGDKIIGHYMKVKVVKNKLASPHNVGLFPLVYGQGVDIVGDIFDVAVQEKVISKAGSWYSFGDEKLGQGRNQAIESIISKELLESVKDKLDEISKK